MTPQQEHIALQNFKTSMIASGHGEEIDYDHALGDFCKPWTQSRWLGYKRCWEEQVLASKTPAQGTAAPSSCCDGPDTEEFVFVGGPLHGLHHLDPNVPWLVTEQSGVQYLYIKRYMVREAPHMFVLTRTHTLR